jgi:hypothetical protein
MNASRSFAAPIRRPLRSKTTTKFERCHVVSDRVRADHRLSEEHDSLVDRVTLAVHLAIAGAPGVGRSSLSTGATSWSLPDPRLQEQPGGSSSRAARTLQLPSVSLAPVRSAVFR